MLELQKENRKAPKDWGPGLEIRIELPSCLIVSSRLNVPKAPAGGPAGGPAWVPLFQLFADISPAFAPTASTLVP